MPPLNDHHRRHILHGFLAIHKRMADLEALIVQSTRTSPFSLYVGNLSPTESKVIQDYFVRFRCEPKVRRLEFAGHETARPHPDFIAALADPKLRAVVVCPSNPFISVDPILSIPGVREALRMCAAPVVAVSPIVGGKAVKGPTAKMMEELGLPVDAATVAYHYRDILDLYVADEADRAAVAGLEIPVVLTRTLMQSLGDREALARTVLAAADNARKRGSSR